MRILALDIGDKRIGLAISDPFNSYALPLKTYFRKNLKTDLVELSKIIKEKEITNIVCGLPVNFDGSPSIQTQKTGYFIDRLKETVNLPIETVDERCTTVEAERVLIEENMSREDRKKVVDAIAATYILEGYLNKIKKEI
ncbi:MAG: Holliday junction resolvase RuvX [Clostridia bacterium]|nr:Holliday junction resolvase RuvX [Clostridia bacterium]